MTVTTAGRAETKAAHVLHRIGFGVSSRESDTSPRGNLSGDMSGDMAGDPERLVEQLLDRSPSGSVPQSVEEAALVGHDRLAATMAAFWTYHLAEIPRAGEHMSRAPLGPVGELARVIGERELVHVLWRHFVGAEPDAPTGAVLRQLLRDGEFEILPVLERVLRSDAFLSGQTIRMRLPYEWTFGALRAVGIADPVAAGVDLAGLWSVGQPPSIEAGQIAQTSAVLSWTFPSETLDRIRPEPTEVLSACGVYAPSDRTSQVLDDAVGRFASTDDLLQLLFALALTSPDFLML